MVVTQKFAKFSEIGTLPTEHGRNFLAFSHCQAQEAAEGQAEEDLSKALEGAQVQRLSE